MCTVVFYFEKREDIEDMLREDGKRLFQKYGIEKEDMGSNVRSCDT